MKEAIFSKVAGFYCCIDADFLHEPPFADYLMKQT